ncbi:possible molecular chaperone [Mycobacterium leprae]|uniref:Trigger factor n=3 Tax=Mycobacterium leprae TaxID=1769 RepID=TIG_MYCLE|nr:trigger factor [Mycobacterium leprae]B8ZRP5.1 RecName: Full=Trigger factor; Short=TF; AltName: Full=PPIase [Mycobacterium leprae Br4923]Q9CBY2.1 RecName: Full=Trigger factor; Short=TF; AltName: Full=PPIase [Mycobacterium leprae TN]AWV48047.1 trigger factor [Mycobacterium leprae]OAR19759.1 trigger factor [Mycobacterium leprae 3125609]OAX71874.1 trigger factor [Mycobacterium leprae 7935681]CAC30431.1 possible molecular chaperone [Mycobacterium leprae]CAR71575.1 possible molecular chaperone 
MKSSVEQLNPTRVRINVEVPFTELEPDFQRAYKELARHVQLPGFRPGKVPARLLEARFGRETLLDQVVNEAMPSRYGQALAESEVQPIGQPEIEVIRKEYGQDLAFTVEVEVRPKIALPDFSTLKVVVDPVEVSTDDVEAELRSLRARFGTLIGVDRPVALGDFVSIDLSATINGEKVPNADAEGLSHEVGYGRLIAGLDDALVGLSAGESRVFTTQLATSKHAGQDAEVIVTVKSVKERELPEPDDEFAQLVSEFDTMAELRANLGDQVRKAKYAQQAEKIRDAAVDALLERVDVPLPEGIVQAQFNNALHDALSGLGHDEAKFAEVLAERGSSREEFEAEARSAAERDVTRQLLLDVVADDQKIQVGQDDLNERLLATSQQYGVDAQQLFGFLRENNRLSSLVTDARRRLAVAAVVEAATFTDSDGNTIDTSEFFGKHAQSDKADQKTEEADPNSDAIDEEVDEAAE